MSLGILIGKILFVTAILLLFLFGLAYLAHRRQRTISIRAVVAAGLTLLTVGTVLIVHSEIVEGWSPSAISWAEVLAYLSVSLFALTILDSVVIGEYFIERKGRYIPDVVRTLLLCAGLLGAALVVIHYVKNINLIALIALPTVATAVVGMALKDTIARFFAGIELGKVIKMGDWIATLDREGVVVDIGLEHVTLLTREQDHVCLPNDNVIQSGVTNYTRPTGTHICSIFVEAAYRTSPARVCAVLIEAASAVEGVLASPKTIAMVTAFNESGIQYRLKFPIGDYGRYPHIESAVRTYIWNAFDRAGIEIPFPQRVVQMRNGIEDETSAERTTDEVLRRLGAIDMFAMLKPEQLQTLAGDGRIRNFLPGEPVVRQGEAGHELYAILEGDADVRVEHQGLRSTVATIHDGQFFGEMSLLTGEPRSATVVALTSLKVIAIGKDALTRVVQEDGKLIDQIGDVVARRKVMTDAAKERLSRDSAHLAVATERRSLIERIQTYLWGRTSA